MLPNNKLFIVWILDGMGLYEDVVRWEILSCLIDYEAEFIKKFDINWKEKISECFRWSCIHGHLDVAKWLVSIDASIDIHKDNEYIFRWCCRWGYLNVIMWLCTLCDKYRIYVSDHYIGYEILE